jgi:predicted acyltransferase
MKNSKTPGTAVPESQRLMSLDALRGFDMFWILGADSFVYAFHEMAPNAVTKFFAVQLDHAEWAGFHFYDLIFPMFVFMMGVSTVFSLTKIIATEGRAAAVKRVLRRGILLFVIALIYSGGFTNPWPDMRLMGVLNRIALCYTFGALLFIFLRTRAMVAIAVALLLGYWALLALVPFPDVRPFPLAGTDAVITKDGGFTNVAQLNMTSTNMLRGSYIQGVNLTDYLDQKYLPARKYDGTYDPEGILSTMPATVTALLGIFAGLLIKKQNVKAKVNPILGGALVMILSLLYSIPFFKTGLFETGIFTAGAGIFLGIVAGALLRPKENSESNKVSYLLVGGLIAALLGWLWNIEFPVIKKIWSSSYVLCAGGYSAMLLGAFYWIVDIKKWRAWCQPFVWIGMNPITLYLTSNFIGGLGYEKLARRLAGGPVENFLNTHIAQGFGELVIAATAVAIFLCFARFLYQRKIFLRL